jgi:hypothetical protein
MQIHLKIIGIILIALALIHIIFPKYFNWDKELKSLSLINQQMMTVHTFFIAFTVFLMGLLCLASSNESWEKNIAWTWHILGSSTFYSVFRLFDRPLERQNF